MTPEKRIDAALDSVLIFTGVTVADYKDTPPALRAMREAMRKIMSDSYIDGSTAVHNAMMRKDKK